MKKTHILLGVLIAILPVWLTFRYTYQAGYASGYSHGFVDSMNRWLWTKNKDGTWTLRENPANPLIRSSVLISDLSGNPVNTPPATAGPK